MTDSATLSGGVNPTGYILFTLAAPDGTTVVDEEIAGVTGNGAYSTPNGYQPSGTGTLPGTYQWSATYSGDSNNSPVQADAAAEALSAADPSMSATPGGTVVVGSGVALTDSVTLAAGFRPTGTITFTLTAPGGNTLDSETATVAGNGTYRTPTGYVPTGTGTLTGAYTWIASYSGDSNNNPATPPGAVTESVSAATPTLTVTPAGTVVPGSGAKMTASTMLAGGVNPTGAILFTLTAPGGGIVDSEIVPVSGNGTYSTPTGFAPQNAGTCEWLASFSGDANNSGVTSKAGAAPEDALTTPTLTTTPTGAVVLGGAGAPANLTDSAMLTGGVNPTGTITFTLIGPGATTVDTEKATVNGNGTYTTSAGYALPTTGTVAGTYQWDVSYSGDSSNSAVTDSSAAGEPIVISPANPTVVLTAGPNVTLGTTSLTLTASATLAGGYAPGGTIVFSFKGPNNISYTQSDTVTGDGTYTASATGSSSLALTGTYTWSVAYSGDENNNTVNETGTASNGGQTIVAAANPALATAPNAAGVTLGTTSVTLTDTAALSGGYQPTGTVTFTLIAPDGSTVDSETATVSDNGTYTTPVGYTLPTKGKVAGIYQWQVSYSGDANNAAVTDAGAANERVAIASAGPTLAATPGTGSGILGPSIRLVSTTALLASGYNPTGTITFTLIAPGGATVDSETVTVRGNGSYTPAAGYTLPTTGTVTGTYVWEVAYSGDGNNSGVSDTSAGNEQLTAEKANPSLTPAASPTTVALSAAPATLTDAAALADGYRPTGTLTFTLMAPDGSTVDTETVNVSGNGTYGTPAGYALPATGAAIGTYQWSVAYGGDGNNNGVNDSNYASEQVQVGLANPTLTATPGGTVVVGGRTNLTDTATLAGGYNPSGYILFTLTAPGGATVDREMVLVSGNGAYSTPTGYLPTVPGMYQWNASYAGDGHNNAAGDATVSETARAANSPALAATPGGTVVVGSTAKLSASVILYGGAGPTGTLTFYLFAPGVTPNATGSNDVYSDTVTVSGNNTYSTALGNNKGGYRPGGDGKLTGTYEWVIVYHGDRNNNAAATAATETVSAASPKLSAKPGAAVVIGSGATLTDSATLSGGANPGGYALFTLTAPDGTIADSEIVPVTGNATYSTPNGYVPTAAGAYHWTASYTGDGNNNAVSAAGAETVTLASPTLVLAVSRNSVGSVGRTIDGSVTLAGGDHPTGTITFYLFAPGTTPKATGKGSVYSVTVAVDGIGVYTTPANNKYRTTKTGAYQWVAVYSGDSNNKSANTL
jgi:hypothetical protein